MMYLKQTFTNNSYPHRTCDKILPNYLNRIPTAPNPPTQTPYTFSPFQTPPPSPRPPSSSPPYLTDHPFLPNPRLTSTS